EEVGFGGPAGAAGLAAVGGRDERDEGGDVRLGGGAETGLHGGGFYGGRRVDARGGKRAAGCRSEEHTSELQSRENLVCRLLLEGCFTRRDLHSFPTRRSSDLRGSRLRWSSRRGWPRRGRRT